MTASSISTGSELRRVLTLWELVLYGISIIIGAGIYVALGSVMARAGDTAPISFLLAGGAAALTGLCYAELASRFPEAAGAAAYVQRGFNSKRLSQLTGAAMALTVAIAAAAIAQGAVGYLAVLVQLPAPLVTALLIASFTAIAVKGVRESVLLAAAMGVIEIAGLLAVIAVGFTAAPDLDLSRLLPSGTAGWFGVVSGAYIAFFAFIGFETLANMAEEAKDASRTVPRAILGAIASSSLLYVAVAAAVVFSGVGAKNPMMGLFDGRSAIAFATLGSIAVANGVLIEIVMLARLFYGMARREQLPAFLATINPRTRTPVAATLCAGAIVLAAAVFLPFEHLLVLANALTLAIFALVAAALWRVKSRDATAAPFVVPAWVPPVAACISVALIVAEVAL